jgi:hypothetical protein
MLAECIQCHWNKSSMYILCGMLHFTTLSLYAKENIYPATSKHRWSSSINIIVKVQWFASMGKCCKVKWSEIEVNVNKKFFSGLNMRRLIRMEIVEILFKIFLSLWCSHYRTLMKIDARNCWLDEFQFHIFSLCTACRVTDKLINVISLL